MSEIALTAGRIHYEDRGSGQPILFVHGTPTFSFDWRHLIAALSPRYRCVAPDLLGFGHSERPRDFPYTPEAHAAVLAEFVERVGLTGFTLVVHDYGGPIALPLAFRPWLVTRLVLLNTWGWSLGRDLDMRLKASLLANRLGLFLYRHANFSLRVITPSAYGDRAKLTPEVHRQLLDRFPDAWSRGAVLWPLAKALLGSSAHYDAIWRNRESLRKRPALIVWGMKDPAFPPRLLKRWREALPEARVVELPRAGHWPHEEEPEAVADALRGFLSET